MIVFKNLHINCTYVTSFGFGKGSSAPGDFNLPTTIDIHLEGDFYVTERGNERVQKIDSNGKSLVMWGSSGSGDSHFVIWNILLLISMIMSTLMTLNQTKAVA